MICRMCGTEIADKAIVCYRCGAATTEPRLRPATAGSRGTSRVPAGLALVLLLVAGLYMGQGAWGDDPSPVVAWILVAGSASLFGWQLVQRRRRRRR